MSFNMNHAENGLIQNILMLKEKPVLGCLDFLASGTQSFSTLPTKPNLLNSSNQIKQSPL